MCPVSSARPGAGGQPSPCVWTGWPASGASAGAGWLYPGWLAHLSSPRSWSRATDQSLLELCTDARMLRSSPQTAGHGVTERRGRETPPERLLSVWILFKGKPLPPCSAVLPSGLAVLSVSLCDCSPWHVSVSAAFRGLLSCPGCSSDVDMHLPRNVKMCSVSCRSCE